MSIDIVKHFRFRDSYNSKTLNAKDAWIFGQNGLLRGGDITVSGLTITVQPFVFVQNGLVVEKVTPLTINIPSGSDLLNRRHFIGVSVANNVENAAEVLTAVFVVRPEEQNPEIVLIAEYDGSEYRKLPYISIKDSIEYTKKTQIESDLVGIKSGFETVQTSPGNYVVSGGVITDKTGSTFEKQTSELFSSEAVDAYFPDRIDQIVLRKPIDSPQRVASLKFITGDAQKKQSSPDFWVVAQTISTHLKYKTKIFLPKNTGLYQTLCIDDYGTNSRLAYTCRTADFNSQLNVGSPPDPAAFVSQISDFDAQCDDNGLMHFVGVSSTNNKKLIFNRLDHLGILTGVDVNLATRPNPISDVRLKANFKKSILYITWLEDSGGVKSVFFMRTDLVGNEITGPVSIQSSPTGIMSYDIWVDAEDDALFLAYEESGSIKLKKFDLGSGTSLVPPNVSLYYGVISDDSAYHPSLTPFSGAASNPKVVVADNKELYVFFHQVYDTTNKAIVIYSPSYKSKFGAKALYPSGYPSSVKSLDYDVFVSDTNNAHIIESIEDSPSSSKLIQWKICLYRLEKEFTLNIENLVKFSGLHILKNKYGVILSSYVGHHGDPAQAPSGTPIPSSAFGPGSFNGEPLTAQQLLVDKASVDSLPRPVIVGDPFTVQSDISDPNNGISGYINNIQLVNILGVDYYKYTTTSSFTYSTSGVQVQFYYISDDSALKISKSIASLAKADVLSDKELSTDVWISRINIVSNASPPTSTDYFVFSRPECFGFNRYVRNLYEFLNSDVVGGGTISWQDPNPNLFSWSAPIRIYQHGREDYHRIPAGSVTLLENEFAYVTLPQNPDSNVPLVVNKANTSTYQLDRFNQRNLILVFRKNNILHSKWAPFQLDPGESVTGGFGQTVPQDVLDFIGSPSETTSEPNYVSEHYVTDGDNLVEAISILDSQIHYISTLYPEEERIVITSPTYTISASSMNWDASNTKFDIVVYKNGQRLFVEKTATTLNPLTTEDYRKINTNTITFATQLIPGDKIVIRKENAGASIGNNIVKKNNTLVAPGVNKFNFVGPDWTILNVGDSQVDIHFTGGSEEVTFFLKSVFNNTGSDIPAGAAVCWNNDGSVSLADAANFQLSDFAGITVSTIPHGSYGNIIKEGNCFGVITGLGAVPGQKVYLSTTPGQLTLTPPTSTSYSVIQIGIAEPPSNVYTSVASDLYIRLQVIAEAD